MELDSSPLFTAKQRRSMLNVLVDYAITLIYLLMEAQTVTVATGSYWHVAAKG